VIFPALELASVAIDPKSEHLSIASKRQGEIIGKDRELVWSEVSSPSR
jgi:hypothetical protein